MNKHPNMATTFEPGLMAIMLIFVIPSLPAMLFSGLYMMYMGIMRIAACGLSVGLLLSVLLGLFLVAIVAFGTPGILLISLRWTNFSVNEGGTVTLQQHHYLKKYSDTFDAKRVTEIGVIEPDNSPGSEDLWHWVYVELDGNKTINVTRNSDKNKAIDKAVQLANRLGLPGPKLIPSGELTFQTHRQIIDLLCESQSVNTVHA